jgi:hypothetical protein
MMIEDYKYKTGMHDNVDKTSEFINENRVEKEISRIEKYRQPTRIQPTRKVKSINLVKSVLDEESLKLYKKNIENIMDGYGESYETSEILAYSILSTKVDAVDGIYEIPQSFKKATSLGNIENYRNAISSELVSHFSNKSFSFDIIYYEYRNKCTSLYFNTESYSVNFDDER